MVQPWGGGLAIDILDRIDLDTLAAAEPTWLVGFSATSTVHLVEPVPGRRERWADQPAGDRAPGLARAPGTTPPPVKPLALIG